MTKKEKACTEKLDLRKAVLIVIVYLVNQPFILSQYNTPSLSKQVKALVHQLENFETHKDETTDLEALISKATRKTVQLLKQKQLSKFMIEAIWF